MATRLTKQTDAPRLAAILNQYPIQRPELFVGRNIKTSLTTAEAWEDAQSYRVHMCVTSGGKVQGFLGVRWPDLYDEWTATTDCMPMDLTLTPAQWKILTLELVEAMLTYLNALGVQFIAAELYSPSWIKPLLLAGDQVGGGGLKLREHSTYTPTGDIHMERLVWPIPFALKAVRKMRV